MGANIRTLGRAVCISILCHLAVLLSFHDEKPFGESAFHVEHRAIDARLLSSNSETQTPPVPFLRHTLLHPPNFPAVATKAVPKIVAGKDTPVLPSVSRLTAADRGAVGDTSAAISGETVPGSSSAPSPIDSVSPDGVRQYRLNLAREARRFKRYPALARQRGWEGVVVVIVTMIAGGAIPHVSLSQSSGIDLLDQEALELVSQAVHIAAIPESLRNRQFALTLPIHYRLED